MIDIHTHVIPGVDDGSPDLETSLKMIQEEIDNGITTIVCTPHHIFEKYTKSKEEILNAFNTLNNAVKEKGLPVKLILGQEIYYSRFENVIDLLNKKELFTLGDTRYVLVEFSFTNTPEEDISEIMYKFQLNKYKVILAHVERYPWLNLNKIEELKEMGILIQVNANAVLGIGEAKKSKHLVKKLLKKNLVDIIASDVHSFRHSSMGLAKKKLKKDYLFEAKNIFDEN